MADFISNTDKDSLMRASYYQITRNFTKSVNRFIAFKDSDRIVEIPHGIGQRSQFIDLCPIPCGISTILSLSLNAIKRLTDLVKFLVIW